VNRTCNVNQEQTFSWSRDFTICIWCMSKATFYSYTENRILSCL